MNRFKLIIIIVLCWSLFIFLVDYMQLKQEVSKLKADLVKTNRNVAVAFDEAVNYSNAPADHMGFVLVDDNE